MHCVHNVVKTRPLKFKSLHYIYLLLTLHCLHSTKQDADTRHCRETDACPSLLVGETERADHSGALGGGFCTGKHSLSWQLLVWYSDCVLGNRNCALWEVKWVQTAATEDLGSHMVRFSLLNLAFLLWLLVLVLLIQIDLLFLSLLPFN